MVKPCTLPALLEQIPCHTATKTLKTGEPVNEDPQATYERVILWFYLAVNLGSLFGITTVYTERYVGWWLSFFIALLPFIPLVPSVWWSKSKLVKVEHDKFQVRNTFRILVICFQRNSLQKILRGGPGFFDSAKQSVIARSHHPIIVPWSDKYVDDIAQAVKVIGILCFVPIHVINYGGLGEAINAQSTMLRTDGVPNELLVKWNPTMVILLILILNLGLYPYLRKRRIRFGSITRITIGFFFSSLSGAGSTILNYYAYKKGPCGQYGTSLSCVDNQKNFEVADISIWWMAIPYSLKAISELFANVTIFEIVCMRSPKNMTTIIIGLWYFAFGVAQIIGIVCAPIVKDPYLTW
jgi:dipeptide/tripeptide permease